jgi:hypothetical protein
MMLRHLLAVVALLLAAGSPLAQADLQERQALAKQIIDTQYEIMNPAKLGQDMMVAMRGQFDALIDKPDRKLSPSTRMRLGAIFEEEGKAFMTSMEPYYTKLRLRQQALYAESFSVQELTQLRDFTVSPAGRKNLEFTSKQMPTIMAELMQDMQPAAQSFQKRLMQRINEEGLIK